MTTLGDAVGASAGAFREARWPDPWREARRLVAAALALSPAALIAEPTRALTPREAERVRSVLSRVLANEPLSRVLGRREFWGLYLALSAATLDPRPDSETVIDAVLARVAARDRPYRVLDLGTGSGALLLALLSELPAARGIGLDIAEDAAATARANARRLGLARRAHFVVSDWDTALRGQFDIIVSNPPYIATAEMAGLPPEVRLHDPARALDGGTDGLDAYRALAALLPHRLAPGGLFAAEIGHAQAAAVSGLLRAAGLRVGAAVQDLAGRDRCILGMAVG